MSVSWCKCFSSGCHDANVPLVHAMMRMSTCGYVMMQMFMWVCHDVNVYVGMSCCKCLLGSMPWCRCSCSACHDANAPCKDAMNANARLGMQWMQMSPWEYAMIRMPAWEYAMVWMSSCRYAMNANAPLWVYHDTECFGANTIYSKKKSFYFQNEASITPETKIFSNSIYYSWKVIFLLT